MLNPIIESYLEGCTGCIEATSFEYMCLWREYTSKKADWKENLSGHYVEVGRINFNPINISLRTAVISGHKILFWHATSPVVDYNQIEKWLLNNLPVSCFEAPEQLNKTDAQNFYNVFPHVSV